MAESFISGLLEVSLGVSVVIAALLLLSPATGKRYGARWSCWVWLIVAARLLIPVNMPAAWAPIRIPVPEGAVWAQTAESQPEYAAKPSETGEPEIQRDPSAVSTEAVPGTRTPESTTGTETDMSTDMSTDVSTEASTGADEGDAKGAGTTELGAAELAFAVWVAGAAIFLVCQFANYGRFLRYVRRWSAPPKNERVFRVFAAAVKETRSSVRLSVAVCPGIASPMATGFFRPVLLLDREDYDDGELAFIIRHELTHVRRRDIEYKLLLMAANAAHWFNPLVWLMARAANRELEVACDEAVTRGMSEERRGEYSEAILSVVRAGRAAPAFTTYFYGGKETMAMRLKGIFDRSKKRRGTAAILAVLAACVGMCALVACGTQGHTPSEQAAQTESTSENTAENAELTPLAGVPTLFDMTDIKDAIYYALLEEGLGEGGLGGETCVASYALLGKLDKYGGVTAYVYARQYGMSFVNGVLTVVSEKSGPAALEFAITADGEDGVSRYKCVGLAHFDGEEDAADTFPKGALEGLKEVDLAALRAEEQRQAESCAVSLREGAKADMEPPKLDYPEMDSGAAEALAKLHPEYPDWIGTVERVENGVRYVYEFKWEPQTGEAEFIKMAFSDKTELTHIFYKVEGGKVIQVDAAGTPTVSQEQRSAADKTETAVAAAKYFVGDMTHMLEFGSSWLPKGGRSADAGEVRRFTEDSSRRLAGYVDGSLSVNSFTAVGYPTDLKGTKPLTRAQAEDILALLAALRPTAKTETGSNPPTGGGWQIIWDDGTKRCVTYNGEYIRVAVEGDAGYLSMYVGDDDGGINTYIWGSAYGMEDAARDSLMFYKNERVTELYVFEREEHILVPVPEEDAVRALAWVGRLDDSQKSALAEDGFFIVTEKGKYFIYMGESRPDCLAALWNKTVKGGEGLVQWLAYMDPAKVKNVTYMGGVVPEDLNGFSNVGWESAAAAKDPVYSAVTVAAEVLDTAKYLRGNCAVKSFSGRFDGIGNPNTPYASSWTMTLEFTTGVTYRLYWMGDHFEIYSSDLGYSMAYKVAPSFGLGVARQMSSLSTVEQNPWIG